MILLCLVMSTSDVRFGSILVQAMPWESSLAQQVVQTANRTNCWVCAHFPEHLEKGVPLIGDPIFY